MTFLRPVWQFWRALARDIGDLQARVLLTAFYFGIVTFFALIMRIVRDPLDLARNHQRPGWVPRHEGAQDLQWSRRQY